MDFEFRPFVAEKDAGFVTDVLLFPGGCGVLPSIQPIPDRSKFQMDFLNRLGGYFHSIYMVESEDRVCGFFLVYEYRGYDRNCMVGFYMEKAVTTKIIHSFLNLLRKNYPLRKVFVELPDIFKDMGSLLESAGFKEEARLIEYKYINGSHHDVSVFGYTYPEAD